MLSLGLLAASASGTWIQLGALIAVGAGAVAMIKRRRLAGPRPQSIPLTSQHTVHVVEAAGVRLVVGTGPGAAPRLLCQLDDRTDPKPVVDRPAPIERPGAAVSAYRPVWAPSRRAG
ncbi:MAG: hypothetical protein AAF721_40370 [Myxococcota bacterium]